MKAMPFVLAIGGSDSSGGAGIQQDTKTLSALGCWAFTALTSVTAQTTGAVRKRFDIPPAVVDAQIRSVAEIAMPDAVKTGMLGSAEIVRAVASAITELGLGRLVVDPVMISSSGARLLDPDAVEVLVADLLPHAALVTPNTPEAEALTGIAVTDRATQTDAARALLDLGAAAAVVTGGHVEGPEVTDVVASVAGVVELTHPRAAGDPHGTGCVFATAAAAGLARGLSVVEAIRGAASVVEGALEGAIELGEGLSLRL